MDVAYFVKESGLFEPHRLAIVLRLAEERDGAMGFTTIRRLLGLTDGNLNRHLHRLEQDGIVEIRKTPAVNKRVKTIATLHEQGRGRLAAFCAALGEIASHGARVAGVAAPTSTDVLWRRPEPEDQTRKPRAAALEESDTDALSAERGVVVNRYQDPD